MAGIDKWYECPFYAIMKEDYSDKRFEKCPLVAVPEPHGRLIDETAIKEITLDDGLYVVTYCRGGNVIADIDAPTVIEAEGEE